MYIQKLYNIFKKILDALISKPLRKLPLNKSIVFESHPDFTDNSKVLFDKMIEKGINKDYKLYWLVKDVSDYAEINLRNVKFVDIKNDTIFEKINSEFKKIMLLSRCKYYFFSHNNYARTKHNKNQIYFNLTHGVPLKDTSKIFDSWNDTYILAPSNFSGKLQAKGRNSEYSKVKTLGFPRNDLFFTKKKILNILDIDKTKFEDIIIWMPTFRRTKDGGRNDTGTKSDIDLPILKSNEDIIKLDFILKKTKILLIIKPHPAQNMSFFNEINTNNIKMITNKELTQKDIELYELLAKSSALITDYSSVYIDYLILDNPIAFTIDDLEKYDKNRGFLVNNPLDYMPGSKIKNINDLFNFIKSVYNGEDKFKDERNHLSRKFNKYFDDLSSNRIIDFLEINKENK